MSLLKSPQVYVRICLRAERLNFNYARLRENDDLRWPHRDGLIWPHFASVVVGVDVD